MGSEMCIRDRVFITGIKEYVFEAFDVSAFHYLLKPIEESKFIEVLGRAAGEAGKKRAEGTADIHQDEESGVYA